MSDVIIVDILDNVYCSVYCGTSQALELKEFFTCYAPDYRHNPKFKSGSWNGKISFFDKIDRLLPIGLIKYLKPFLIKYDYRIKFVGDMNSLKNEVVRNDLVGFYDALFDGVTDRSGNPIYPREYQQDAIYAAIRHKRGVLESATGSGKSIIIYSIIRLILEDVEGKVLLVVPTVGLVNQMYSDFKEYGWDDVYDHVALLYGKSLHYDKNKSVLISTWQSIYKRGEPFFSDFDAVIVDETHGAKSSSIQTVLKKCVNAHYRLGLTGTLPDADADLFNIYGYLGPKIYTLKSKTLIDAGFLSKITVVNLFLKYSDAMATNNIDATFAEESSTIAEYSERNKVFSYIISHVPSTDNVLILCQKIAHLESIVSYITETFPARKIFIISGQVSPEVRESIRHEIEGTEGAILIATYGTMSTGVNIPKLHHVIFASSYKAKIKVLQSIGRGLRLHSTKKRVIIWDIVDDMRTTNEFGSPVNNYVYTHFLKRLQYYKAQGFEFKNRYKRIDSL